MAEEVMMIMTGRKKPIVTWANVIKLFRARRTGAYPRVELQKGASLG
jgi:hypothetical protein